MFIHDIVENRPRNDVSSPDFQDIVNDPMKALSKGWSFLSYGMEELGKVAVTGAQAAAQSAGQLGRYANEQWNDPNLRDNVNQYVSSFTTKVGFIFVASSSGVENERETGKIGM